jgi:hypothetical protein
MSAIDRLRDIVATHSNAEAILWSRAEFVAVLQEIDELQKDYATFNEHMWKWYDAYHQLKKDSVPRFGRHIGAEIEDGNDLPSARIQGVEETFEWSDEVIAVTPEQLVRIVKEAGKS